MEKAVQFAEKVKEKMARYQDNMERDKVLKKIFKEVEM